MVTIKRRYTYEVRGAQFDSEAQAVAHIQDELYKKIKTTALSRGLPLYDAIALTKLLLAEAPDFVDLLTVARDWCDEAEL